MSKNATFKNVNLRQWGRRNEGFSSEQMVEVKHMSDYTPSEEFSRENKRKVHEDPQKKKLTIVNFSSLDKSPALVLHICGKYFAPSLQNGTGLV